MIIKKLVLGIVIATTGLGSLNSYAAMNDATVLNDSTDIQRLIKQVEALTLRIQQLEKTDQTLKTEIVSEIATSQSATSASALDARLALVDRIKLKGDFRLRYENIDDATKATDRDRTRLRARIETTAKVTDDWSIGLGLASGSDDPISTNQTLGKGGTSKGINLDLAYFDWSGLDNVHVIGGKFKNPFYKPAKHGLIWDGDYRPEGLALKYDNGTLFANAGFMFLESDNKAGKQDDESFLGAQFGFKKKFGSLGKLTAGVSYFNIGVAGSKPFLDDDSFGNTLINNGVDDVYQNDYQELELFAEWSFKAGSLPASIFVDWVQNQDADDNDTGYAVGATLGKGKKPGTWKASYIYQDIEADAVFGLTSDSDFGGGGTGSKGHLFKVGYAIQKNVSLGLSYFSNERGALETDYDRLQLDLKLKY